MTRFATFAILVAALAAPSAARAQHQAGGAPSSGTATSSAPSSSGGSSSSSSSGGGSTSSTYAAGSTSSSSGHSRGNQPANGTAVPRGSVAGSGGSIVIGEGGFYPWGYPFGASLAYADLGAYYYDGYYGAYDPWYGWSPMFAPGGSYGSAPDHTGSVRLKVKPEGAAVYVDGFLAGTVDDFDGAFQRLKLLAGPHRIEIRAQNFLPLAVDVMIQEDFTITYRGQLAKQ